MNEIDNPVIRRIHAGMDDRLGQYDELVNGLNDCANQAFQISQQVGSEKDEKGFLIFQSFFHQAALAIQELEQKLLWMGEMKWQPIETAPADGTPILLWWRHCPYASVGKYVFDESDDGETYNEGWQCDEDDCIPLNQHDCTHWMHLPEAPQ